MSLGPMDLLKRESPEVGVRFAEFVQAQGKAPGLDAKTRELVMTALLAAHRNLRGVKIHAQRAVKEGATRAEVVGAVVMNLHISGLTSVNECLPVALEGVEEEMARK